MQLISYVIELSSLLWVPSPYKMIHSPSQLSNILPVSSLLHLVCFRWCRSMWENSLALQIKNYHSVPFASTISWSSFSDLCHLILNMEVTLWDHIFLLLLTISLVNRCLLCVHEYINKSNLNLDSCYLVGHVLKWKLSAEFWVPFH